MTIGLRPYATGSHGNVAGARPPVPLLRYRLESRTMRTLHVGLRVVYEPASGATWITDPDGYRIELVQWPAVSGAWRRA